MIPGKETSMCQRAWSKKKKKKVCIIRHGPEGPFRRWGLNWDLKEYKESMEKLKEFMK